MGISLSVVAPVYNEEDVIEKVLVNWVEILKKHLNHYYEQLFEAP